ncbi:hypothetical protein ABHI18_010220 [Aspergillus niger]
MRLINVNTLKLEEFYGDVPRYAILSHTWGADHEELSFREITRKNLKKEDLPFKLQNTNLTELSEAIVSMFQWYKKAAVCYAYLADVTREDNYFPLTQFCSCRWFQRGWTLQELLAPDNLHFFDSVWHDIGTKANKSNIIDSKIGIPRRFLQGAPLSEASVAQRMFWASKRVTKREEDIAYCLLGIFDVTMPMIYGEGGDRAFTRLQRKIMRNSRDESILAWGISSPEHYLSNSENKSLSAGVLAASPANFEGCQDIVSRGNQIGSPCTFQIEGGFVRVNISLLQDENGLFGLLNCGLPNPKTVVAIPLSKSQSDGYLRPQDHCAVIYDSIATKTSAQPVYILTERHIERPPTASYNNYFFVEDPIEMGLELIEVEPPDRWLKDRSIITTSNDHAVQKLWARFRSHGKDPSDFLVLLEYSSQNSQAQARRHMMISSRATSLQDLAQGSGSIRQGAFDKQCASDGMLSVRASVERDSMQEIFVVKLAAIASPPSVTIDATFELVKLEVESIMKEEDYLRREKHNLEQHVIETASSLRSARADLTEVEEEIENLNGLKSRLLDIRGRASQDMVQTGTRAEKVRQQGAMLSECERSLERELDGRQQAVLELGSSSSNELVWARGDNESVLSNPEVVEVEAELTGLVETEVDLVKHIDTMLKRDPLLRRFFSDKKNKGFLVYLWRKAEDMYSGHGLEAHYEKPMAQTLKASMYQQVFYCDDSEAMGHEDRWNVQTKLVKQLIKVTSQLLPAGKGVGLRFNNREVDESPNLTVDRVNNILNSMPLRLGGNTAVGTSLTSKILEPLVYSKAKLQILDRPLLIMTTIGGCPETEAESEIVDAIIECGRMLEIAGYPRRNLQLKNLLLPGDPKNFSGLEDSEIEEPSPTKVLGPERTIYTSHIVVPGNGLPLLSDFGEARFSEEEHDEDIMPNLYRAPEVVLKMKWDNKVDVWSSALMVRDGLDMACSQTLFDGRNSDDVFDDRVHLAEMVAIMGPPPTEFIKRSKVGSVFWDEDGKRKELAPVPNMTLEERAADIQGPDKEGFLKLMRRALTWDPEDRLAAGELIFDEWLMKGLQLPAHLSKNTYL